MNEINRLQLPVEIIHQILEEFENRLDKHFEFTSITTTPYLKASSYIELIQLRLISKNWSKAVLQFYFRAICVAGSRRAKILLENWNDLFGPADYCPVNTLTIRVNWLSEEQEEEEADDICDKEDGDLKEGETDYVGEKTDGDLEEEEADDLCEGINGYLGEEEADDVCEKYYDEEELTPASMDQLVRVINLLGTNLKTLNLHFVRSMGVSTQLIEAMKTIRNLKSLSIYGHDYSEPGTAGRSDLDSISELFTAIPRLDSLSFHYTMLGTLIIKPPSLSNLRSFSYMYSDDPLGLSRITQTSKDTLKLIQLDAVTEEDEALYPVFEPIKNTLEGLFTLHFTCQIHTDVRNLHFPNLRVMRTECVEELTGEIHWLNVPMLKNIRTLITDLRHSEGYWLAALEDAGVDALKKVPNFKHIVFVKDQDNQDRILDPKVVEAFESRGVQCHVLIHALTCDEYMELDHKLNGPVK
ncbi:uncharacterized protein MELLADRAFT_91151 [Melampsora larici-populina 98AG31]|uniref:F-box domain-containing protein n=1 Tax=Melampsora larici-populina (strain 98AG31 / pathotype 3-4-7) TaxID=747676 RepID=F4RY02_MELLP|nr:uncharacterized protein MELLADRAFT_91151 [Melampsora larici-populina 98AG31]EGG02728.1 hypothetical protein MELLADRAFT_91151 [Melampsora larici-populina 98AG31]